MKRVHLLEPSTALIELNGTPIVAADRSVECDRTECDYEHFYVVPESELATLIEAGVAAALERLGLSGRAVS